MLGGLGILLLFLLLGEGISALGVGVPGSVLGMVLLALGLALRVVRVEQVEAAGELLLDNLAFFFIPPGVGVMVHFGVIADHWLAIALAILVSTVLVLITVGVAQQWLGRRGSRERGEAKP